MLKICRLRQLFNRPPILNFTEHSCHAYLIVVYVFILCVTILALIKIIVVARGSCIYWVLNTKQNDIVR